jgi:predicted porin
VRKLLICALALGGFAASAQAADLGLDGLKDPLPDTLTWRGVTVYGVLDVGYGYESFGLPNSGSLYTGQVYNIYGDSKGSTRGNSNLTNNALSQSTIGVKIEENIGLGWVALGHLDTGFNPLSGEIADACASLVRIGNADLSTGTKLSSFGDGSRCGQAFNGEAYAGISNPTYGTWKIGRQNSLDLDALGNYDPMGLSYAMSLIGYSGGPGGGVGSTETARWDNSIKWIYQYGPFHIADMYAEGAQDTSLHGDSYAGDVGVTYKGFSLDVLYTNEKGAVNAQIGTGQAGQGLGIGNGVNDLAYFITNNEAWSVMGKYVYNLGGGFGGLKDGGFKDGIPGAKLTFYGGYQHTDQTQYHGSNDGGTTIGGYNLSLNDLTLNSTRTLETAWAGAKYETGPWAFTTAYYWLHQDAFNETNSFLSAVGVTGAPTTGGCGTTAKTKTSPAATITPNQFACAGDLNQVSFLVDYTFTKHFDVYGGISYQNQNGGFAHSSLSGDAYGANDNTTVVSGVRLKF